jgi:predicted phosphodiesterase
MRSKRVPIITILFLILSTAVFAAQDQKIQEELAALEKIKGKFSFVVIGDNRSGHEVYKKLAIMTMALRPSFVVNTGDMIQTPGDKKGWANFWDLSKIITAPYFLTVGNHDAHPMVPFSEKMYKEQVDLPGNELYYSFTAGNSLFVVLDSYIDDQEKRIMEEQLQWLEGVLASSDKKHKFVFLHHPLFTEPRKGRHAGDCMDAYRDSRDKLEALFVKTKVDAVYAGHEHFYQRKTVDGITHVITGGGGAPMYLKDEDGGFYHFVHVTVDDDKVSAEVIDGNGKVRDRF